MIGTAQQRGDASSPCAYRVRTTEAAYKVIVPATGSNRANSDSGIEENGFVDDACIVVQAARERQVKRDAAVVEGRGRVIGTRTIGVMAALFAVDLKFDVPRTM